MSTLDQQYEVRKLVDEALKHGARASSYGMETRQSVVFRNTDGSYNIECDIGRFVGAKREKRLHDPQAYDSHFPKASPKSPDAKVVAEIVHDSTRATADRIEALHQLMEVDDRQAAKSVTSELQVPEQDSGWRRQLVVAAEELQFVGEERTILASLLFEFAIQRLDSNCADDAPAVRSAIRTYASLIPLNEVETLSALVDSACRIDVTLTVFKSVSRIFECYPPEGRGQYPVLDHAVVPIAEAHLNPFVLARSDNAAIAVNALVALAAMRSSRLTELMDKVHALNMQWFEESLRDRLRRLANAWADVDTSSDCRSDLHQAIESLSRHREAM